MAPPIPSGSVFDPGFHTAAGLLEAGSAFALELPSIGRPLLVTCQHLFGPAGGLSKDVPPGLMSRFVESVSLTDALGHRGTARAGAALAIPGIDSADPMRDLAAFPLDPAPALHPLRIAADVPPSSTVYLAARLRKGAPPGVFLFPASILGSEPGTTLDIFFDDATIHLPGTSGAPVLNDAGELVGMVVRFRRTDSLMIGCLLPARQIQAQLLAAPPPPPPPKRGLLQRLFG
jgi:hypothetical protein